MKKLIIGLILLISSISFLFPVNLKAGGICEFVPCNYCPDGECTNALSDVSGLVRLGLSLIFVFIIILGVVFIVRGALKIIRSEGDEKKVQEGYENIRGVIFGVIIIFVGIIGIIIVTSIFNAQGVLNEDVEDPPLVDLPVL